MKIVAFHLFNDYSGSPKVLKMVLEGLLKQDYQIEVVTSKGGVLDELKSDNVRHHHYSYHFSMNPVVTMIRYTFAQLYTFFFAFRYIFKKDVVFYINTILPVGPALAGRLMGKRVVYHYHENAYAKSGFYSALANIMQKIATDIMCVSAFQRGYIKREKNVTVVPNALSTSFTEMMSCDADRSYGYQTVLMVASLKKYKGIMQFFELASRLPQYQFVVVVNDDQRTIDEFVKTEGITLTENLTIYPRQERVAPFYQKASMVLNLSDTSMVLETFGLTALEAMSAGLPVIVPTKGGVAELVEDGIHGYKIDVSQLDQIEQKISEILGNKSLYEAMSHSAYEKSKEYSEDKIIRMVTSILDRQEKKNI